MSITLAKEYVKLLDEVYATESLTAPLIGMPRVKPSGRAGSFLVQKLAVVGAGDYSRTTGHPAGDAGLTWEEKTYAADRGRRFTLDSMDAQEAQLDALTILSEFVRTKMVPEIDAYRFAKWASTASIDTTTGATLDAASETLAAIDVALTSMKRNHVKQSNLLLFLEVGQYSLLKNSDAATRFIVPGQGINRDFETFDNMPVVQVPQDEFYTQITLDAGATSSAGGYTKTSSTGKDINFMIVDKTAVFADMKHGKQRLFDPDTFQDADAWAVDYRAYHDAWVLDNKVKGVYLHKVA
jgi:hypothetical protein